MAAIPNFPTLIGLSLLASLSPILTLSRLWQVKEWRIDRLRENFVREEGMLQLVGILRPIFIAGLGILELTNMLPEDMWISIGLGVLALGSALQIALRKQPMPIWTQKAISIVSLALLITLILSVTLYDMLPEALPFLPLIQ